MINYPAKTLTNQEDHDHKIKPNACCSTEWVKEPLDLGFTCDKLSYLASQSKVRDGIIELYKDERSRPIYWYVVNISVRYRSPKHKLWEEWTWSMNLKYELEVWSWSLDLKNELEVWTWSLILKFDLEVWSWSLNLKNELEEWTWSLILKYELEVWPWRRS